MLKFIFFLLIPVLSFSQINFEKVNEKTHKLALKYLEREEIPGMAISISYNDTIVFSEGFGYADLDTKKQVIPSKTLFEIASITKMITVGVLAKLYEANQLDFTKSAYFYLDSLPKKEYDFSINELAGHLSGLQRHPSEEMWSEENNYSKKDFYRVFEKDSMIFEPSTNYKYSNYGYKVLGKIIENILNMPIERAQDLFLFKPLKMTNTKVTTSYDEDSCVKFYTYKNKERHPAKYVYNNFSYAEGCHLSTSEDLIKLGNAFLFPNRLLTKETIIELVKPQSLKDGKKTNYGKGFEVDKDNFDNLFYGHGGNAISARSELKIYPNSKLVITMVANKSKSKEDDFIEKIANNYINLISKSN